LLKRSQQENRAAGHAGAELFTGRLMSPQVPAAGLRWL
jgi:hypothetical protein